MNTATHTPTPWDVCQKECSGIGVANMDDGVFRKPRKTVAITAHGNTREGWHYVAAMNDHEESAADAAFIVRACNAHDELVAALRSARKNFLIVREYAEGVNVQHAIDEIDAALARAGAA